MIAMYILGGICLAFAFLTATLYFFSKNKLAGAAKLCASMLFISMGIIALFPKGTLASYGFIVLTALVAGLAGDALLMIRELTIGKQQKFYTYFGVSCFYLCQILLIIAFLVQTKAFNWYLLPLTFGIPIGMLISDKIGKTSMKSDAPFMILYGMLLSFTLVCAVNYYITIKSISSLLAMLGSIMFAISDTCLGMFYYGTQKRKTFLHFPIMIFYYLAQCLYAFSVFIINF